LFRVQTISRLEVLTVLLDDISILGGVCCTVMKEGTVPPDYSLNEYVNATSSHTAPDR
jgi:hypothetical protein